MAQKIEKLDDSLVQTLKELQSKANESVISLGEVQLRLRDLDRENEKAKQIKEKLLLDYDDAINQINFHLKSLESMYSKGEIDLAEGTVIYEVSE